ncbi:MAG: hypothetical protein ACFB2X_06275 [Rivularia sp. (in: cyanobacteria)]
MIRRLIVTSVLAVLSAAAIAPKANAQSIDVPFTGTVGGACSFTGLTPGKLVVNSATNATRIASYYSGGADGKVSITCNRASSVKVSKPIQTAGPKFTPTSYTVRVDDPSGKYTAVSQSVTNAPLAITTSSKPIPLKVRMSVTQNSTFAPGNYGFKTTLTVTPR